MSNVKETKAADKFVSLVEDYKRKELKTIDGQLYSTVLDALGCCSSDDCVSGFSSQDRMLERLKQLGIREIHRNALSIAAFGVLPPLQFEPTPVLNVFPESKSPSAPEPELPRVVLPAEPTAAEQWVRDLINASACCEAVYSKNPLTFLGSHQDHDLVSVTDPSDDKRGEHQFILADTLSDTEVCPPFCICILALLGRGCRKRRCNVIIPAHRCFPRHK